VKIVNVLNYLGSSDMLYFDMTFIYVGSMERKAPKRTTFTQDLYVEVSYNFETDTIQEKITPYGKGVEFERVSIKREYFIQDWQTDVVDKYTPFIVERIATLRRYI
jgi:hypothetical protein